MVSMKDEILSRIQKKFPLVAKPFEAIANELGISEDEVLAILQEEKKNGINSIIIPKLVSHFFMEIWAIIRTILCSIKMRHG